MFGRRRKKDEDSLGLPSYDSSSMTATPSVSVSTNPSPTSSPAPPPAPAIDSRAFPTSATAMLGQILSGRGPVGDLISEIKADPQGFRARIMAQAQAAGVSTFVMTPQGFQPVGGSAAAPPGHVDVVEELTKASELHDRGALTDAEFAALKKKLLGE
jgi:Short C-terminal domain